ncbi:MAG: hypothetical protein AB7I27_01700 [Bacteriovoracaceae bacterium]
MKRIILGLFFTSIFISKIIHQWKARGEHEKTERELANEYFPIQSPSEEAQNHPIVGVS